MFKCNQLSFQGKHYKQIFGTAMGSPVSMVVANLVMEMLNKELCLPFTLFPKSGNI